MTSQTPGGEPPPEPQPPEPDAETARVPVEPPSLDAPDAPNVSPPEATPAAPSPGLISAQPTGSLSGQTPPPGAPLVSWAAPTGPVAAVPVAEGLVIAGTFTRLVAYAADLLFLGAISVAVDGALGLYDIGRDENVALIVGGILVGVDFLYFVGLWTSGLHATLGMRMLRLRILDATTATTLSPNDAVLRWLALSGAVAILTLVPGLSGYIGLVSLIWLVVLLATTAMHPLHQGLHDRWARSVVVTPGPGGSGLAFATCLIMVVLVFIVLPFIALLMVGDQVSQILSQIGNSI
jgi:uncharacterized RDD family membrane protein YckC